MKIFNYLFKMYHLVKSAGSRPMEKRAFKNKKPTLIPGLRKPWRAGTFSSYSLINRPHFRIAAVGIESCLLVTSCEPTLK